MDLEGDGQAVLALGSHLRVSLAPCTHLVVGGVRRNRWGDRFHAELELARGRAWLSVRGNVAVLLSSPMGQVRLGRGAAVEVACEGAGMKVMAWRGEATCLSRATATAEYLLAEGQALLSSGAGGEQRIESLGRHSLDPLEVAWLAEDS